jgi:predicted dehydrogenase/threonine dehydrogenase-like Zn-dependent dehydrogenase
MKQLLVKSGKVSVEAVAAPQVGARNVLVRVQYSCISVGTEMAGVAMSALPLYRRALKQPEHARKALQLMRDQGIRRTYDMIAGRLSAGTPTGYSAAGVVIAVGSEVEHLHVGDRVACAGAGIANHAEIIDVPVNLAAEIPQGLSADLASTVTLGAIALQGVRRAQPTLGESFVVVGLGILGQIAVQLLKANGCRVLGVDLDPRRIQLALENGMDAGLDPARENYVERVQKLTDGYGADGVIVTAASSSDKVISEALQSCRRKGRAILVGDVGLHLQRADLYRKELDFLISTSYGPGRYDALYEEGGLDYPIAYVRWTENRNMEAYLRLLADGKVKLSNLLAEPFDIDRAPRAYEALSAEGPKPLLVLLHYPQRPEAEPARISHRLPAAKPGDNSRIRLGLVGAGGFAQGMHLPNLVKLRSRYELRGVVSRTGANARAVAIQYSAAYSSTDFGQLLHDPEIDLLLIATRHNLHARMVLEALRAGKHVFVEKPLALDETELQAIERFYSESPNPPLLMTGFNRRFSPAIRRAAEVLAGRTTPFILNYRMNAGFIPADHWVHGPEGGGRNIGEACHIYDLFNYLTGASVRGVQAVSIAPAGRQWRRNDNFVAVVSYTDGSVCTLTYTALGAKSFPKERMEIFCDGKVIALDDYKSLAIVGGHHNGWKSRTTEKGQFEELQALAAALRDRAPWPISLDQQLSATRISFEVERQISGAEPLEIVSESVAAAAAAEIGN